MIKYTELESIFASSDLIINEYNIETDEEIELPYLVYATAEGESFGADGISYYQTLIVALAFIDESLNFKLQRKVESILTKNGTYFEKAITFNDDARLYTVTYSFVVEDDAVN